MYSALATKSLIVTLYKRISKVVGFLHSPKLELLLANCTGKVSTKSQGLNKDWVPKSSESNHTSDHPIFANCPFYFNDKCCPCAHHKPSPAI